MHRRDFLALLSTPALVALLQACSSDGESSATDGTAPPRGTMARSDLARTPTSPDDALEASGALDQFGIDLYRLMALDQPTGNIVISPASIAIALSMVLAGAKGETAEQLAAGLRVSSADTIHHAMNSLTTELESRSEENVILTIESSLWAQYDVVLRQAFLDLIAAEYAAGVHQVDYRDDAEGARAEINDWVDQQTAGRIPELLAEGAVSDATRLTLVNAIYMKAPWLQPFDVGATTDQPFTTTDGTVVQVPAMAMRATVNYGSGDGWQAIDLAYDSHDLTMIVILPEEGTLAQFEEEFLLTSITPYMSPTDVRLQLPRFEADTAVPLIDLLKRLGVEDLFDGADLSGMSDDDLQVSAVVHQANISVDEAGTEAAAATAVVVGETSAPADEPIDFTVDRPFLFAIRDRGTEAYLFLGRIGDPR